MDYKSLEALELTRKFLIAILKHQHQDYYQGLLYDARQCFKQYPKKKDIDQALKKLEEENGR